MTLTLGTLEGPTSPYEINLFGDVVVEVAPLRSVELYEAEAVARSLLGRLAESLDVCEEFGFLPGDLVDLDNPVKREALYRDLLTKQLARMTIKRFVSGIVDQDGAPCPVTPGTITAIMDIPLVAPRFYTELLRPYTELAAAKKDSGVVASGLSSPAAAPVIAKAAAAKDSPAPAASQD